MSRIPLLPLEGMPEKTRAMIIGGKSGLSGLNINKMVAHAENSARHFMRFGNSLLTQAKLEPKLRELAILRIAALCHSHYEWYQHEILAREVGVPEVQIDAVQGSLTGDVFSDREQAVLKYTEEVTFHVKASEEAFTALKSFLDNREIVELTLTIGFYNLVARFLENTGVELERRHD